jgi:YQGE family putative transporter
MGLVKEYRVFRSQPHNMQVILVTNLLYAMVLPIVEIFAGAYVMRNTNNPSMVAYYQLAMYVGVAFTSFLNGWLMKFFSSKTLYMAGILVSGVSLFAMMLIKSLGVVELGIAGFLLGAASGFFWTNRYLLTLYNTNDDNRNYFFGLESFFFSIMSILIPLIVGGFISQLDGRVIAGHKFLLADCYQIVTGCVVVVTIIACLVLSRGNFERKKPRPFLFIHFHILWWKMLLLAALKGLVQGFLVTAPAILILKFIGNEGSLGLIQGISGALTAILVYVLGRVSKPKHRLPIFLVGLVVFFIGTLCNGILFSAAGVLCFVLCKVFFQPLFDLAYYPIMMRAIDTVSQIEHRNEYAYIQSHEIGLFVGRAVGLSLFIFLAYIISQDFALKYALVIVAGLQLLAYPLAKNIVKQSNNIQN